MARAGARIFRTSDVRFGELSTVVSQMYIKSAIFFSYHIQYQRGLLNSLPTTQPHESDLLSLHQTFESGTGTSLPERRRLAWVRTSSAKLLLMDRSCSCVGSPASVWSTARESCNGEAGVLWIGKGVEAVASKLWVGETNHG